MANLDTMIHPAAGGSRAGAQATPRIRTITVDDLVDSLRRGWADFLAQPTHLIFVALIYPIIGVLLARLSATYNILPLIFPLMAGFALLGPFAAIGLYEISRRRERGLDASAAQAFEVMRSPALGQIALLGLMLTGLFLAWLASAWLIYRGLLGLEPPVTTERFVAALTTFDGWIMMIVGNAVGALFAVVAFTISVVSFPLMLDRHVDLGTAVRASVAAVEANPRVMLVWGLMIAGLLALGSLPVLVGLVVVMPVLGHASWHVYRKLIAEDETQPARAEPVGGAL